MKKQKWYFLSGFLVAAIFLLALLVSFNNVLAIWAEPTSAPPNGNIDPFSKSLEDVLVEDSDASTFSSNVIVGDATHGSNLYWDGGEVRARWIHSTEAGENTMAGDLTVAGTVTANEFLYSSDKRLKSNIETIISPLDSILKLRGVSFDWNGGGKANLGFIAQEVEQIYPELVKQNGEYKAVNYAGLIAPLLEAVKKQQGIIEELEQRIVELESNL
jgi:hypothetical protein